MNKYGFLHISLSENNVMKEMSGFIKSTLVVYSWFYIADVRIIIIYHRCTRALSIGGAH